MDFYAATELDTSAIAQVQMQLRQRILRTFVRRGLIDKGDRDEMLSWEHGGGFSLDASVPNGTRSCTMKERAPHYLMKEANLEYVQCEEVRQKFSNAAEKSFKHYKETGQQITLDEFSAWVDDVQSHTDTPITACHT